MFTDSAQFYDAIYSFKDYSAEAAQIASLLKSLCPNARTLLDVGCGTGEHAHFLAENHGFEVDGLDLDAALLGVARKKHPGGRFFEADMSDFALQQRYDAVLCLFSSIGYLVTLDRVRQAFECFRRHLNSAGVVLVEPWFPPGRMEDGRVVVNAATHEGMRVERTARTELDGRISRLHFQYRIEGPDGPRELTETHELGLFTVDEMREAFKRAGLRAEFDRGGPSGRGLWVARAAS